MLLLSRSPKGNNRDARSSALKTSNSLMLNVRSQLSDEEQGDVDGSLRSGVGNAL